ncbi:MAG TPA: hypothetical protein VD998_02200 [Verrucomicrobiae bacterium]|nr:hypothetical protein [Verrucomicrobiae bacterium]
MTDEQIPETFKTIFKDFIEHDIQAAIEGKANYLAALGIFSYMDFLGGLLTGNIGQSSEANFDECLKYFPNEYLDLDKEIRVQDDKGREHEGIYGVIRCGLVHEYMIKGGGVVNNNPLGPIQDHTGISYVTEDGKKVLVIFNNELFRDFRSVIDRVYDIIKDKKGPVFNNIKQGLVRLASRTQIVVSPSVSASVSPSLSPSASVLLDE